MFENLIKCGFTSSLEKSKFFRESVKFLGVVLDKRGISPDPENLQAIQEIPSPKNKAQLQAFLGMCGFYRRFCIKYEKNIH